MSRAVWTTRAKRILAYLKAFGSRVTLPRILNLIQNEIEYHRGVEKLRSFPPNVTIDITNRCNLRCPLCATGKGETGRPSKVMPLADFEKIIDQISEKSFQVFLYCWGEPLLVKNIADYVRVAKKAGLAVILSSNFSLPISHDRIESLILAGVDRIIVSMDGITAESYSKYRLGGNFDLVKENVRRFAHAKAKLKTKSPKLIWQFLAFNFNEDQIPIARKLYTQWGFDDFEVEKPNLPFGINDPSLAEKWFAKNSALRLFDTFDIKDNTGRNCFWPWRLAVIQSDGALSPCCYVSNLKHDSGNVIAQGFSTAWNSPDMQKIRMAIRGKGEMEPCFSCSAVKRKS